MIHAKLNICLNEQVRLIFLCNLILKTAAGCRLTSFGSNESLSIELGA